MPPEAPETATSVITVPEQESGTSGPTTPTPAPIQTPGSEVDHLKWLTVGVVIVLFVGFAGVLIGLGAVLQSHFVYKQATYEDLRDEIVRQSEKINLLIQQNEKTAIPAVQPIIIYAQQGGQIQSATGSSN